MHSSLYEGWLRHRRLAPTPHAFRYPLYMTYLDLAEIDEAFRGRWLAGARRFAPVRFRRKDYLGDANKDLAECVRERIQLHTGVRPCGPIRLLTHLSHLGYCFNPVSFYYCFDERGERVENVLAEITNTPWGERHAYVLQRQAEDRGLHVRFAKTFHVSPFMPMEMSYDWRLSEPGDRLSVHMNVLERERKAFDATLLMRRRPLDDANLARMLLRHPLMPAQVAARIYRQAARLWLKGAPFHPHPRGERDRNRSKHSAVNST